MNTLDRPFNSSSTESVQTFLEQTLQNQTTITTADGLQAFDALDVVDLEFMLGRWQGVEVSSNHPMDGLLDASNWYGKEFISADHVHPLLFSMPNGDIIKVAPNPMAMKLTLSLPLPKNLDNPVLKLMLTTMNVFLKQSRVRLVCA